MKVGAVKKLSTFWILSKFINFASFHMLHSIAPNANETKDQMTHLIISYLKEFTASNSLNAMFETCQANDVKTWGASFS